MVTFTFDDVPASACDLGASILETYDARGTFYVAGALLRHRQCRRTAAGVDRATSNRLEKRP